MRLLWLGAYHRNAERNVILLRGLQQNGVEVIERHFPMEFLKFRGSRLGGQAVHTLLNVPRHGIRLALAAHAAAHIDAVYIGYMGHLDMALLSPLRLFVRSLRRRPVVFDPFFSLYDTVVSDRSLLREGSASARLLRSIERFILRHADIVLADTAAHAAYYADLAGMPLERFHVVPVGMDDSLFTPQPSLPASETAHVLFYGTYIPLHGVPTILDAARLLRSDPIRFRLIGRGQTRATADAFAREHDLTNVEFIDSVPRESLPSEIAHAHIVLGIFGTSDKAARVIPNKVYQAMAVGRCVITRDSPAIREAFIPGEHLITCPAGDAQTLAQAIRDLATEPVRRDTVAREGCRLVQEHFSSVAIGRRLMTALATRQS